MTSTVVSLRQRRSLSSFRQQLTLRLLTNKNRSRLAQGFTLVELMVVIVIVGILAAVALPQFLGVKDGAKMTTQLGEASGLAKECSAAIITGSNYPAAYTSPTGTGLAIAGPCDGTVDVTFTTNAATTKTAGIKCGATALAASKNCQLKVDKSSGQVSYAAV